MTSATTPSSLPDTVLVVDDEPAICKVLELALRKVGLPVRAVGTAEAAIAALDAERFGAVVTDKNLPGKSGLDVIREAKAKQPYCAVVMVTGFVSTESVLEALRLGANDYLLKPFTDLMLVAQRVKAAIEHQRTEFERALLADTLRSMQKTVQAQQAEAFQRKTELDLFQSVVEVKVDDATQPLKERVALLEAEVRHERERRAAARERLLEFAKTLTNATEGGGIFPEQTPEAVAARLVAEADLLASS